MDRVVEKGDEMKWEYLQVSLNFDNQWIAFDGNSICDGDRDLLTLLNRLGQDEWEHYQTTKPYLFLKRNPKPTRGTDER